MFDVERTLLISMATVIAVIYLEPIIYIGQGQGETMEQWIMANARCSKTVCEETKITT